MILRLVLLTCLEIWKSENLKIHLYYKKNCRLFQNFPPAEGSRKSSWIFRAENPIGKSAEPSERCFSAPVACHGRAWLGSTCQFTLTKVCLRCVRLTNSCREAGFHLCFVKMAGTAALLARKRRMRRLIRLMLLCEIILGQRETVVEPLSLPERKTRRFYGRQDY